MSKPFWGNPCVARCFAELFWIKICETIHAVIAYVTVIFNDLVQTKMKHHPDIHPSTIPKILFL